MIMRNNHYRSWGYEKNGKVTAKTQMAVSVTHHICGADIGGGTTSAVSFFLGQNRADSFDSSLAFCDNSSADRLQALVREPRV